MSKIGICDWGIGGIGILIELQKHAKVDVIYLSDAGHTPYGKLDKKQMKIRLQHVFNWFAEKGIDHVIVGCNAASTVLQNEKNKVGMIRHGISMIKKKKLKSVVVLGGRRTILSGAYRKQLTNLGISVKQRIAQPLSARIETGDKQSNELCNDIRNIFKRISKKESVLLACTHYPLISDIIIDVSGNKNLLDPAEVLARWVIKRWKPHSSSSSVEFFTTGDINQMTTSMSLLYKIKNPQIKITSI